MLMPSIFGENLFDNFFDDFARPVRGNRFPAPATGIMKTDVKESDTGYELGIELPGYKKEDVQAELKDGYLTISASMNTNKDEKDENGKYIRRERFSGSCSRQFYVGEEVLKEDIKAKFDNGILFVTVPKKQPQPEVEENHFITIEG